jgi:branched-chain amino acid transport system permease protein
MVEESQPQRGGTLVAGRPAVGAEAWVRRLPLQSIAAWLAVLALILAIPRVFDGVWLNNFNLILTAVVAVTGLNLLVGYTGQVSLGHAAFAMIGAFTVALMYDRWPELRTNPYQLYLTLPAAGITATLAGTLFGVPSLRVKGLYLAIATLAAHPILTWVVEHLYPKLTVEGKSFSSLPIPRPILGIPGWEHTIRTDVDRFYLFAALAVIGIVVARNIIRTRVGRAFIAIRDNDIAAESSGISLFKYKLMAFAVSSFYAGVAGAMLAYYFRIATVESFQIARSVEYLAMVIIGGMGSIPGPVLGALFIVAVPILVRDYVIDPVASTVPRLQQYYDFVREVLFGLLIILFIIWEPDGLNKLRLRLTAAVRRRITAAMAPRRPATGGEPRGTS